MKAYFFGVAISLSLATAATAATMTPQAIYLAADTLAMLAIAEDACDLPIGSHINSAIAHLAEQDAGVISTYRGLLLMAEYALEAETIAGRLDTYCAAAGGAVKGMGWE